MVTAIFHVDWQTIVSHQLNIIQIHITNRTPSGNMTGSVILLKIFHICTWIVKQGYQVFLCNADVYCGIHISIPYL